jgi:hypothetical protein
MLKTVLVIRIVEHGDDVKRVVETPVYAIPENYPELMSYQVLQIEPAGAEIKITITESNKE